MKKIAILVMAIMFTATASFAQTKHTHTTTHQHSTASKKYTCTMHPEVVKNKPGKCPKCGMALVPMKKKMVKKEKSMDGMKM